VPQNTGAVSLILPGVAAACGPATSYPFVVLWYWENNVTIKLSLECLCSRMQADKEFLTRQGE